MKRVTLAAAAALTAAGIGNVVVSQPTDGRATVNATSTQPESTPTKRAPPAAADENTRAALRVIDRAIRDMRRRYPRRVPAWTNARYRRHAQKLSNRARHRAACKRRK